MSARVVFAGILAGFFAALLPGLALGGRARLDLILDMFNLLNHTNYTQVNAVSGGNSYPDQPLRTFNQFTKAAPPFQAQLAAKVSF